MIQRIHPPPKTKAPPKERSTIWVEPVTAKVFRDLVKHSRLKPSVLLNRMLEEYIRKHHKEVVIEQEESDVQ